MLRSLDLQKLHKGYETWSFLEIIESLLACMYVSFLLLLPHVDQSAQYLLYIVEQYGEPQDHEI